ncbi:MAG TPA: PAS domain S-box protein, partial [Bacteroidales bacterium]|nr:PAS domain S-box protein [Bacteroidales bacterium]
IGLFSISAEIIHINEQLCVLAQCKNITESKRIQQENDYRRQVLDTLMDNLPIGVFMVEAHTGKPIFANNKACELLGRGILPDANEYNISEVYQAFVLGTNQKYPIEKMPIIRAMHGEKSHVDDMIVYRPNGDYSILEIFGAPVYNDSGTVIASLVSFFDISERKKSEQELAQKSKELEQFFTTSLDLLCIADSKGNFIRVNKEWEKVLGYSTEELEKHSFLEFVHPDDLQQTIDTISKLSNQISVLNFTNRYKCKDGQYRWIEWRSAPQGDVIYAAARDITERIEVEQELLQAKQKAEESDTLKTAFLQNMSHEIRTPLNAIMGFSELMPETFDDKENLQKYSSIIRQRSADLLEIINDILDIAKIESGQLSIHTELCTLRNIIHEVELFFSEYRVRIKKEHIEFIVRIEPQVLQTTLVLDQIKLKQILINLITNAFKFTYNGYIELGCTIKENNVLFIYVADTGIGISPENQSKIFKRFVQASTDTSGLYSGTGLGLSIIKGLLNIVGGEITITSELDKGSTFYFTYPFELPSVIEAEQINEYNNVKQLKLGLRILIVEDDDFNAQYLEALLNQWKCYVDRVSYGKKAVYVASDKVYDVILMDIRLPDITGYEAAAEILAQNPQQKIIAQTAFAGIDEKNKSLKAGCINYISKPIHREELYTMLVAIKNNI